MAAYVLEVLASKVNSIAISGMMSGARCNARRFPKSCQQGDKIYHKPSGDDFADVSMTGSGIAASTQFD